jgi:hypothetical protein
MLACLFFIYFVKHKNNDIHYYAYDAGLSSIIITNEPVVCMIYENQIDITFTFPLFILFIKHASI